VEYPLPIPEATLTTTQTPMSVAQSTLPCMTLQDGCVTSPNYPLPYSPSQRCEIPYTIGKLNVMHFDVEMGYDYLKVNHHEYSGATSPDGLTPTSTIIWSSDDSGEGTGWKICPMGVTDLSV